MSIGKIISLQRLPQLLFLAGIFILPFVFWPWSSIPFEIPKVLFLLRWSEVLGILALISLGILKEERLDSKLIILVVLYVIWSFISSVWGIDPVKSFWGNYYRNDGLFSLIHLTGLFFFIILFFNQALRRWLPVIYGISSFIVSVLVLISGLRFYLLGEHSVSAWNGPISFTFGNPHFLGGYLLVTLPFLLLFKNKQFKVTAFLLQIIAIILTRAEVPIMGAFLLCGLFAVGKGKVMGRIIKILLVAGATIILGFFLFKDINQSFQSPEGRTRIFTKGLIAFTKKPLLGWGFANFDYAFEAINWPLKFQHDIYIDKAHATILEVLVTSGVVGLLLYIGIIIRVIQNLWRQKSEFSRVLLLVFVVYLIHSQTNITSVSEELVFWIISGISSKKNIAVL